MVNGKFQYWIVNPNWGKTLADLAEQYLGERPRVPAIQVQAQTETRLLDVRYIGSAKDRGGETTAFGWVNGQWGAIFPLAVLHEWFSVDTRPDEAPTLYAVLGIKRDVPGADLKKAYRRAARQWHPDVCSDPDAGEQFRKIQHAYEVLKEPLKRKRYDAGLQLASTVERTQQGPQKTRFGWKPPLRCGYILAEGKESLGRFVVSKILQWEMVVNARGQELVTSWPYGADRFVERWV
jgi:DnaJ-domain-containing protein 1